MTGQRNNCSKRSYSHSDYTDNGGNKRRNSGIDKDPLHVGPEDTVYRYLCPGRKIGSIIGRGREIVKQLRLDSKSKIRIGESVPGCEERSVTIYSTSEETNVSDSVDGHVCPAQDALFKVHDRIVVDGTAVEENLEEALLVTARLLVSSDQIGCIIGKGGQIVQNIRSETGAQIRIVKDDHLPTCALTSDELVQISGDASVVKKALQQIASRLHDNPSRSQHLLSSAQTGYPSSSSVMGAAADGPIMGLTPLVGAYGGYKGESADWSQSIYSAPRNEASTKEFSLRLICPTANIGGMIGKGGMIINQIRQDSGAAIKVDSPSADGNDRVISISAKEMFKDAFSPAIDAAARLQPRCSEKVERDSGLLSFTTRLLVPTSQIGCLIGKGGSIISGMRKVTKAKIRILSKENLPKVASKDHGAGEMLGIVMVLLISTLSISGDLDVAKDALIQVTSRLRAGLFDKEGRGSLHAFLPVLPYLPVSSDGSESLKYENRDAKSRGHGYSSGGYGRFDVAPVDSYYLYGSLQSGNGGDAYGVYGSYLSVCSVGSGISGRSSISRGRTFDC